MKKYQGMKSYKKMKSANLISSSHEKEQGSKEVDRKEDRMKSVY